MKVKELIAKLQELITIIDKERYLAKYPSALQPLFLGLYSKNYQITENQFGNKEIGQIFTLCKENSVKQEDLVKLFCEGLTPIKNSESVKNYDRCSHKKLKIQITKDNIDEYDIDDIFYPFWDLETLKGSVKICKELAKKYKDEQVWCEDRERLTTYNEVLAYKEKKFKDFVLEFKDILNETNL